MSSLLLATLLAARTPPPPALVPVQPFLPVVSAPWPVQLTAFALPTPRPTWLTAESPAVTCDLTISMLPDASLTVTAGACPAGMVEDALTATRLWRFAPIDSALASGATALALRYAAARDEAGAWTVRAEIDPGAANTALVGRPGLVLVHGAYTTTPLQATLSRAQKKLGVAPADCRIRVRVSPDGIVLKTEALECPEALTADARHLVNIARWLPRTVDAVPLEDTVEVVVRYVE